LLAVTGHSFEPNQTSVASVYVKLPETLTLTVVESSVLPLEGYVEIADWVSAAL
jgi:hypothetical protein